MKNIFLLLFFIPVFASAQDSTSYKYFVGITYSNDLSYRLSNADDNLSDMKNDFDSLESARYGFSTGVFAGYYLRPELKLQAGLSFTKSGFVIDTLLEAGLTNMKFNYNYLELPVRLSYVFRMQRKLQPIVSFGLHAGYLLQQKTTHFIIGEPQRQSYRDEQTISSFNLGVAAGLGFQKKIAHNYLFQLEGNFRQSITPLSDTPFKRYLFSTGVNLSLTRLF
jgi:hypothetical protein